MSWILDLDDRDLGKAFHDQFIKPAVTYDIPAIVLDENTDKAAVATVFEKVNIGGLPLNVFELLTAVFAGDATYYEKTGADFRLNDYGDYTGLAFLGGVAHVAWADNSNSTGADPAGAGGPPDLYTAAALTSSYSSMEFLSF